MVLTGAPDTMLCRCCADVVPDSRLQVALVTADAGWQVGSYRAPAGGATVTLTFDNSYSWARYGVSGVIKFGPLAEGGRG